MCRIVTIAPTYTKVVHQHLEVDLLVFAPAYSSPWHPLSVPKLCCFVAFLIDFFLVPFWILLIMLSVDRRPPSATHDGRPESVGGRDTTDPTSAKQDRREHSPNTAKGGSKTSLPPRPDLRPKQSLDPQAILVLNLCSTQAQG